MEYHMNELSLTLPGSGWVDRSSNRLQVQAPDGTLVMVEIERREPMSPEETVDYADAEVRRLSRYHRGFELVAQQEFHVASIQGIRVSFRSIGTDGALYHEIAYLPLSTTLMVLVVNGRAAYAAECTEVLRQAVESIQLR